LRKNVVVGVSGDGGESEMSDRTKKADEDRAEWYSHNVVNEFWRRQIRKAFLAGAEYGRQLGEEGVYADAGPMSGGWEEAITIDGKEIDLTNAAARRDALANLLCDPDTTIEWPEMR
jgi:hypothetical protein